MQYAPFAIMGIVILIFIWKLIRIRSLKGLLFNREIAEEMGAVVNKIGSVKYTVSVSSLKSDSNPIGIMFTHSSIMGMEMTPACLSVEKAEELREILGRAIEGQNQ